MSLTQGRNTVELSENATVLYLPVAAASVIYEGAMVAINATGFAVPATQEENLVVCGMAITMADNLVGTDGAAYVNVKRGVFIWDNDSVTANQVTQAHLMKDCYIKDDCTVTSLATASSIAGKVIAITEDGIAVESR